MYILSQDKTRIYNMSGHIEGIGYEESKDYKQRKSENIRHTIQVFDGCAEEIAEFKTKEDCMLVIYAIFKGMEQDSKAVEIPTQEEMEKQKDLIKQLAEAGQEVAAGIEDLLKENMTLYKQAGNSIAVPIFESIFRKIILGEEKRKKDDSERQEGDAGR